MTVRARVESTLGHSQALSGLSRDLADESRRVRTRVTILSLVSGVIKCAFQKPIRILIVINTERSYSNLLSTSTRITRCLHTPPPLFSYCAPFQFDGKIAIGFLRAADRLRKFLSIGLHSWRDGKITYSYTFFLRQHQIVRVK